MELFRKFINKKIGRLIWLILIIALQYLLNNDALYWIITAGLVWFAIDYSNEIIYSKHPKIWKTFAILTPPLTYVIFLLYIVHQSSSKSQVKDSPKIKYFILILLISNIILLGIMSWFYIGIYSQNDLFIEYSNQFDTINNIEKEQGQIFNQIDTTKYQPSLYKDFLTITIEHKAETKKFLLTLQSMQSTLFYKYIPEYKNSLAISLNHINNVIAQDDAVIEYYQEAVKQTPDYNKINNSLQQKGDKAAAISNASFIENEKNAQKSNERTNISNLWIIYIVTSITIFVIMSLIASFWLLIKRNSKLMAILLILIEIFTLIVIIDITRLIFL
jgi:hypothetical protein